MPSSQVISPPAGKPSPSASYPSPEAPSPSAAVIIPLYNRDKLILRTLESVRAQRWRPLRIIVVDNDSTDNSLAVVSRWAEERSDDSLRIEILSERRRGAAAARRKGTEAAKEDILFFFDSDDTMRPDLVESAMREFAADPQLDLVCWPAVIHQLDGSLRQPPLCEQGRMLEMQLVHAVFSTQRVAVRRSFHLLCGGWNPEVMMWNDWELGCRYALNSPRIRVLPLPLVDIYSQEESITGTDFSSKAGGWEGVLDRVAGLDASPHWQALIAYRKVILAAMYHREGRRDLATPLRRNALAAPTLSPLQRMVLRGVYRFTASGLRGAYRLAAPFL